MDTYLMRIFFAFSALVSIVLSQTCEEVHFQRCMDQLVRFAGKEDLIFAESEAELKERCLNAQSALGCVSRFIKKCVGLEKRKEFSDSVSGLQKLTDGLCSESSDLRSRYLKSLPCFKNVSEGMHFCQEKFKRNQNDILQVSYSDKTPLFCCSFDGYRRCLKMLFTLEEQCMDEPSAVIDEVIQRSAGILGEGICDEYFERCTGGGTDSIRATLPFIFAMLLSVLISNIIYKLL